MKKLTCLFLAATLLLMTACAAAEPPTPTDIEPTEHSEPTGLFIDSDILGESDTEPPTFPDNYDDIRTEPTEEPLPEETYSSGEIFDPVAMRTTRTVSINDQSLTYSFMLPVVREHYERETHERIVLESGPTVWLGIAELSTSESISNLEDVFPGLVEAGFTDIVFRTGETEYISQEQVTISGREYYIASFRVHYYDNNNQYRITPLIGYTTELSNGLHVFWIAGSLGPRFSNVKKAAETIAISFLEESA